jgi:hypothetical protein
MNWLQISLSLMLLSRFHKKNLQLMKSLFTALATLLVVSIFSFHEVSAQVSPRISIQGTLKDANGSSVADGTYTVTFRLYSQESGGTHLWQEEAPVEVVGGIYSHYLGEIQPLVAQNFANTLYLGVRIGTFELTPRTELTYAPYTFSANTAQFALYADSVKCSGAIGDVKYSVLDPTQFALVNGNCWIPLDGRNISGSRLAIIRGVNTIPDAGGLFFRAQEFIGGANRDPLRTPGTTIGNIQTDDYKSHNHTINDPGHTHNWLRGTESDDSGSGGSYGEFTLIPGQRGDVISSSTTGITINNRGGDETRPINMNLWTYIRIN